MIPGAIGAVADVTTSGRAGLPAVFEGTGECLVRL